MRPGVPYTGAELAYYEECMRTVPAIALMRAQGRRQDVLAALNALQSAAADLDITGEKRWSILTTTYMAWTQQLFEGVAQERDEPVEDVIQRAISAATGWMTSRG